MRHSRTRTALVAAAALAATVAGPVPLALGRSPAPPDPVALDRALAAQLDALAPDAVTTVVVTLSEALDPTPPADTDRAARREAVVRGLQEQAQASQRSLVARLEALSRSGSVLGQTSLWVTNAVSVTATPAAIRELAGRRDVVSVEPDAIEVSLAATGVEANIATTGAPTLWAAGLTGRGAVVGFLDTGVDTSNRDLAASWRGGANSWFDPYDEHPSSPVDVDGHGTGTAGVVVGDAGPGSSYGMAPGAQWIAARVFDDRGATSTTAIHEAFQWMLDPDADPSTDDAPDVVNASWALGAGPSCDLTLQPDVQALRAAEVVPVVAAGNFGPGTASSASPGNYPESLSVAAVDGADVVWAYSSSGPSTCGGRDRVFPDLVAPGVSVLTADRYDGYQYLGGTSIAAPHVAGALALLVGAHPGTATDAVEAALVDSAVDLGATGPDERYGSGRIDVAAAHARLGTPPPAPADFSIAAPGNLTVRRGKTATMTVSVAVVSGSPGPVALSVSGLPKGVSAAFTPDTLSVPGSAELTVAADRKAGRGTYGLVLTAAGSSVVRTVDVELVVR